MSTPLTADKQEHGSRNPGEIQLPAPTAWPIVLGFGFSLLFAGLLTDVSVSALGAVLSLAGCVGWFREVLPHEHEEAVEAVAEDESIATERQRVERLHVAEEIVRAWLPLGTYPISDRVKGGRGGGIPMAVVACLPWLLKTRSIC